jgi:histidyl-tRNA synthetase
MGKGPQRIRGTQDIAFEEADRFDAVVAAFDRVRRLYAFRHVHLPVFEATEVFARSIGETTDIVSKEMYTFEDKGGDWITLRPEFTAGICRAYLSEGWQQHSPLKITTHGPVFRYERPQKGRFRQFHQLDAEIIGTSNPEADVELLVVADHLLKELGITEGVTLQLNTLGDAATRDAWRSALVTHFSAHRDALSEDSLARLEKNPLRILDSKDPRDRPIADSAPGIDDFLTKEAGEFFEAVQKGLQAARVQPQRNSRLVRGLDYYRHTAFEFVTDRLGAQGAVIAGGRYDGLIESLGGSHTPAVGWAAGIERLMMLGGHGRPMRRAALVIESDDLLYRNIGKVMTRALRKRGMPVLLFDEGAVRKRFDKAQNWGPDYILTLIPSEDSDTIAHLKLRRQIHDRVTTKGALYIGLRDLLKNQFKVEPEDWRVITTFGGSIALKRKPR